MILLLEPPRPAGFVSGGYRYQAEIGMRLARQGTGCLRVVAPGSLEAEVAAAPADALVVVDGLFAAHRRRPLPAGVIALLHGVPDTAPWSAAPLPVIATSRHTATAVAMVATRVAIVRPGLDACFRPGRPRPADGRRRIVCIGTIGPAKGQLLLAEALAAAADAARCDLVLLGSAERAPDYVHEVAAATAPARLHLRGVLSPAEVADELHRADLCVSASREESFGMAVHEAVACGVPVLAFSAGEIADWIHDGANGWLVPTAASDAAFCSRLHGVLADPAKLLAARHHALPPPQRDWDAVAHEFATACRNLVQRS
ncbi:MAG: glycosyltransferase family 4 protein [Planctomycetes bacterium]|nr:glycosyltransferase family 4 protein [Planctomycetota bacterium]